MLSSVYNSISIPVASQAKKAQQSLNCRDFSVKSDFFGVTSLFNTVFYIKKPLYLMCT